MLWNIAQKSTCDIMCSLTNYHKANIMGVSHIVIVKYFGDGYRNWSQPPACQTPPPGLLVVRPAWLSHLSCAYQKCFECLNVWTVSHCTISHWKNVEPLEKWGVTEGSQCQWASVSLNGRDTIKPSGHILDKCGSFTFCNDCSSLNPYLSSWVYCWCIFLGKKRLWGTSYYIINW